MTEHATEHSGSGYRLYVLVWAALMLLTAVTVGVSYLDLKKFATFAAVLIATVKGGLVLLYFMHLRFEARIYTVFVLVALVIFGVFLALTWTDVEYRFY